MNRILVFTAFFLFLACNIKATNIPDSLINFIEKELPGFSIPTTKEYLQDWNKYLKTEGTLPYYCSSDFNGDNKLDYAILLTDSLNEVSLYAFIKEINDYKVILIKHLGSQGKEIQIFISVEQKGDWESATNKINVPNDGISIDLTEESLSWSYYFDGKTFKRFLYD
ncbi:hypothetical protein ACE01N_20140 [Saccharicrinis sp. FJH2]|uniref:hypothetical protein n=1 Tax=Saccharicrinis sp. FJH65 TaxID=3344659 RepID=UPI0035F4BFCF